jgi:hypothetical protein
MLTAILKALPSFMPFLASLLGSNKSLRPGEEHKNYSGILAVGSVILSIVLLGVQESEINKLKAEREKLLAKLEKCSGNGVTVQIPGHRGTGMAALVSEIEALESTLLTSRTVLANTKSNLETCTTKTELYSEEIASLRAELENNSGTIVPPPASQEPKKVSGKLVTPSKEDDEFRNALERIKKSKARRL